MKRATFKTLVDEVQELEAKSEDPGAVVHGKRYCKNLRINVFCVIIKLIIIMMLQPHTCIKDKILLSETVKQNRVRSILCRRL